MRASCGPGFVSESEVPALDWATSNGIDSPKHCVCSGLGWRPVRCCAKEGPRAPPGRARRADTGHTAHVSSVFPRSGSAQMQTGLTLPSICPPTLTDDSEDKRVHCENFHPKQNEIYGFPFISSSFSYHIAKLWEGRGERWCTENE